jgi:thioredoxin-related protein
MTKFRIFLIGLFLFLTLLAQTDKGKTMLLSHRMITPEGKAITLEQVKGQKGLVVIFWSNTCPWVKKYEQRAVKLAAKYMKKGFGFVLVNSNDTRNYPKESLEKMAEKAKAGKYPCLYVKDRGSKLALALGAKRTPHVFVFNEKDELVYQGAMDDNAESESKVKTFFLQEVLEALLNHRSVPYKSTKAIGCTIKFYKQID